MPRHDVTTTAAPAVKVDWVGKTHLGFFVSVDGHAYGPISFDNLRSFPSSLFRHLFDIKGYDLEVALAVSRKVNELRAREWQRLLLRCPNWCLRW
jgi:hypothetical protein